MHEPHWCREVHWWLAGLGWPAGSSQLFPWPCFRAVCPRACSPACLQNGSSWADTVEAEEKAEQQQQPGGSAPAEEDDDGASSLA